MISYSSRSLTEVEGRYSQMKREAFAIVWACEYFNVYFCGAEFNLITDHKPLEIILNNPKSKPSARIARWSIRLAQYKYKVICKPGKNNLADFMSIHLSENQVRFTSELMLKIKYISLLSAVFQKL